MLQIDKIAHSSGLRQLNPHMRVTLPLVCLLLFSIFGNGYIGLCILVLTSLITLTVGRVPGRLYFQSLLAPAFFVLTAAIGILFVTAPDTTGTLFQLGSLPLYMTNHTAQLTLQTIMRAYGSLSLVYLIAFHNTIWDLGQYMLAVKLPKTFVELFVLCYRFIFILLEEGYEMVHAQDLRLGYVRLNTSMKSLSLLISQLFIRTIMRARAMEDSLSMRLYTGEFFHSREEAA